MITSTVGGEWFVNQESMTAKEVLVTRNDRPLIDHLAITQNQSATEKEQQP